MLLAPVDDGEAGEFRSISKDLLPARAREFTYAADDLVPRKQYVAVVALVREGQKDLLGPPSPFTYARIDPVPAITGLNVKRIGGDGKIFLRMTWDKPAPGVDVEQYIIYSDYLQEGRLARMSSFRKVTTNHVDLPIDTWRPRDYTVGVAIRTKNSREGDYVTKTLKNVRGSYVTPVKKCRARWGSPHKSYCRLTWELEDPNAEGIKGFRVYGQLFTVPKGEKKVKPTKYALLFDENTLTAEEREVRIGPHFPWANYVYKVQVVSEEGFLSTYTPGCTYQYRGSNNFGGQRWEDIESEIEGLKATFKEDPVGPDSVQLSWSLDEKDHDLLGYYIIRPAQPNAIGGKAEIKTKDTSFVLPVNEDYTGELAFEVQVYDFMDHPYDKKTATVNIPARQPMPDFFPRKQVLIYCSIASGVMFIVLIVGLLRRNRTAAGNLPEAA